MESKSFPLRLRDKDTSNGVTRKTLRRLAETLGVTETDAIHRALADYARTHLPRYQADEGPLRRSQYRAIAAAVRQVHGRARVVESLFEEKPTQKPKNGGKAVQSPARSR